MNEKMNELLNILGINFICNHSVTIDEFLDICGYTVDEDGEIIDSDGNATGIWYEEIE